MKALVTLIEHSVQTQLHCLSIAETNTRSNASLTLVAFQYYKIILYAAIIIGVKFDFTFRIQSTIRSEGRLLIIRKRKILSELATIVQILDYNVQYNDAQRYREQGQGQILSDIIRKCREEKFRFI